MSAAPLLSPGELRRQNASLLARNEFLTGQLADLRREMGHSVENNRLGRLTKHYRLTALEARLVCALYDTRKRIISKPALFDLLYGDDDNAPFLKILDVLVCKIRAKVRAKGEAELIDTIWFRGLQLTPDGIERLVLLFGDDA